MTNLFYPVANPTASFWLSQQDEFKSYRSTPNLPEQSDVIIIGSGYSGTSVAYNLLNRNEEPPSVVMLEARDVCSGATGRNGGHIRPCSYRHHSAKSLKYGSVKTAELVNFEYDHLIELSKLIVDEKIDCDLQLTRCCDASFSIESSINSLKDYKSMMKNPYIKDEIKYDVQHFFDEKAKDVCHIDTNLCLTYTAGTVWPYKLITHLLKKLSLGKVNSSTNNNFNLQTNTMVLKTEKLADGKFLVTTNRGVITCSKLVIATNAYTSAIEPDFANKITPFKGIVTHISPSPSKSPKPKQLPFSYGISWNTYEGDYLINRLDGSIVVGGGASRYCFPQYAHQFFNNVDDSTLLTDTKAHFEDSYMSKIFNADSSWTGIDTKNDYTWSGIMGYSQDELPFIGELPNCDNKFIIAGFHGHGMPQIWKCGKGIAECIMTGKKIDAVSDRVPQILHATSERVENKENKILNLILGTEYLVEKSKL